MAFPATRLRRMRKTSALRGLVRETDLSAGHLVYPLFVTHGSDRREPIDAMPGIERLTISHLENEAGEIAELGIPAVLLFGIPADKDEAASGAYDPEGIVQLAVRALKQAQPDLTVITDVCLCEYTSHGHCGVVRDDGQVDNDITLELLAKTALSHAGAGADAVMVKPALPYLDVIQRVREAVPVPVAAYNVSGEYAAVKAAAQQGWLNERAAVLESLTAIRRAGADIIFTYHAKEVAEWLRR